MLIDDYDLVATGPDNPFLPLVEHLGTAVTSACTSSWRAVPAAPGRRSFDPLLKALRELALARAS